jgi:glycosyltransferase involved in cell wall biosynthesis
MASATLAEYLDSALPHVAGRSGAGAVLDNAFRFRSRTGRMLLAALAAPGRRSADGYTGFDADADASELNLAAYCDLAYALAAQPLDDGDHRAALAMYGRVQRILGAAVPERDQIAHVRLAALHGDTALLESLRRAYGRVPKTWWKAAEYAVLRAAGPADTGRWLPAFLDFAGWRDLELAESGPEDNLLSRLVPKRAKAIDDGPLVSVVMTCFRPGPELLTAVRSVLGQTWKRFELLLVDDASEPEYDAVLLEAAGLDERVRLLRQRVNGGTYRARNRAMGVAAGAYTTGLDSDDWAHPRWLERQIAPFRAEPDLVMTVAEGIRCTADLEPAISPVLRLTEPRSTSIMYRTAAVRERIGFYDTVLKSGDTEFKLRIQRHFGRHRVRLMYGDFLTVVRQREGSLSDGDVSAAWVTPDRFAYNSAFRQWHKRIQQGKEKSLLPASAPVRPFPAPRALLERGVEADRFDLVVAADWRRFDQDRRELLERAAEAAAEGGAVALVHYVAWEDAGAGPTVIAAEALAAAAEHGLEFADPEQLRTDRLLAAEEQLLLCLRADYPGLGDAEAEAAFDAPAAAAPQSPSRPRRAGGKTALLVAVAVLAVLAGAGFAFAANSTEAALTAAATGLTGAAAAVAVLTALAARSVRR